MQIKNTKIYGLEESIIRSGYPMQTGEPSTFEENIVRSSDDWNRVQKLSKAPVGSGHNNFLKGVIVQFDLKYPQYFTSQLQRYHWIDIISSQSKMHKLRSIKDIKSNCNKYVVYNTVSFSNYLINEVYNKDTVYPITIHTDYEEEIIITSKEECFQYIISNLPMGYELWMGISTNYLQLKTIYSQRKNHKLKYDWGYFCNWIKTLPLANELILIE